MTFFEYKRIKQPEAAILIKCIILKDLDIGSVRYLSVSFLLWLSVTVWFKSWHTR